MAPRGPWSRSSPAPQACRLCPSPRGSLSRRGIQRHPTETWKGSAPAPSGAVGCQDGHGGTVGLSTHLLASRSHGTRFSWGALGRHRGGGWQGCSLCRHPGDTMATPGGCHGPAPDPPRQVNRRATARTSLPTGPSGPCSPCKIKVGQRKMATGAVPSLRSPLHRGEGSVPPFVPFCTHRRSRVARGSWLSRHPWQTSLPHGAPLALQPLWGGMREPRASESVQDGDGDPQTHLPRHPPSPCTP